MGITTHSTGRHNHHKTPNLHRLQSPKNYLLGLAHNQPKDRPPNKTPRNAGNEQTRHRREFMAFQSSGDEDSQNEDIESQRTFSDDEDDWEQGRELIAGFMGVDAEDESSSLKDILAVVESLEGPFSARFKKSQQELVKTLEPTLDHVRSIHDWYTRLDQNLAENIVQRHELAMKSKTHFAESRARLVKMLEDRRNVLREQIIELNSAAASRLNAIARLETKGTEIAQRADRRLKEECAAEIAKLKLELDKKSRVFSKSEKTDSSKILLANLMAGSSK